jgi:hypothetical protein
MTYPPLPGLASGASLKTIVLERRMMMPDGSEVKNTPETVKIAYKSIGEISFPSGQVIVSDLYGISETSPQAKPVPAGSHSFEIIIATPSVGDHRVAFAVLRLSKEPTIAFVSADRAGEDPAPQGECAAVGVDSATICIVDASLSQTDWAMEPDQDNSVDEALDAALACVWKPVPKQPAVAACCSGMGDGVYAVIWGLDAKNRPTCLVVDFEIVE